MQHTHEIPLNTFGYVSLAEVKFRGFTFLSGKPRDSARGCRAWNAKRSYVL